MTTPHVFPDHLCLLARPDNARRCQDARLSTEAQCHTCKQTLQPLLWKALYEGDSSLALALLPSALKEQGFQILPLEGRAPDTMFELARTSPGEEGIGDCFIVPLETENLYEMIVITGEDSETSSEGLDITAIMQSVKP